MRTSDYIEMEYLDDEKLPGSVKRQNPAREKILATFELDD